MINFFKRNSQYQEYVNLKLIVPELYGSRRCIYVPELYGSRRRPMMLGVEHGYWSQTLQEKIQSQGCNQNYKSGLWGEISVREKKFGRATKITFYLIKIKLSFIKKIISHFLIISVP